MTDTGLVPDIRPRNVVVLGSTGSIGVQALEVSLRFPDYIRIAGLSAGSNLERLAEQALHFRPPMVAIVDDSLGDELKARLYSLPATRVLAGREALIEMVTAPGVDLVLNAIVGIAGLEPTLAAIRAGKDIALANKETLVAAGELVMREASRRGVRIIPVDSEHSAIFQCLVGEDAAAVGRLILTSSGGALRDFTLEELEVAGPEDALRHPNWAMGAKVTVDSATLMNKALEVIEARWLFNIDPSRIAVVIHRESVIHSMVEFCDGSIKAQMGCPDMRLPIQYALTYPNRFNGAAASLDVERLGTLTFGVPDQSRFPAVRFGHEAMRAGGTMPAVMNAANEEAVRRFLEREIAFRDIARLVSDAMERHSSIMNPSLDEILEADRWARGLAQTWGRKG
ncbi:MAG: 1-deoxy-D-xylulose-5-phosphate reductoisomerase [Firmicutes bacterium]|nr:1-deoxy-D-xylulose-5-phosphate reductoisomerase [Bacillota bacterium]